MSRRRMLWSISACIVTSLVGQVAHAEGLATGRVGALQSYLEHTGLLVQVGTSQVNPDQCPSSTWYIYPDSAPRAQFVQSALLAAQQSGKIVSVTVRGCYQNYPQIVHFTFLPQ